MFLKSSEKLAKKITALSRDFLWGYNRVGGKRIPLVAWERLAWPKVERRLGLKDFKSHSDSLLTEWFTRALDHPNSDWARLYGLNLKSASWINSRIIRRNQYSSSDILLLSTLALFLAYHTPDLYGALGPPFVPTSLCHLVSPQFLAIGASLIS